MAVFLVAWEINQAGLAYGIMRQAFLERLETFPNKRAPGFETMRWVDYPHTAQQLSDDLRRKLDDNDRIFVTKLNRGERAGWMSVETWDWIEARS